MYTYQIKSTIDICDFSDTIAPGDIIYEGEQTDENDIFETAFEAIEYGQKVLNGLSGGRAYDKARDSAIIEAVEVK